MAFFLLVQGGATRNHLSPKTTATAVTHWNGTVRRSTIFAMLNGRNVREIAIIDRPSSLRFAFHRYQLPDVKGFGGDLEFSLAFLHSLPGHFKNCIAKHLGTLLVHGSVSLRETNLAPTWLTVLCLPWSLFRCKLGR